MFQDIFGRLWWQGALEAEAQSLVTTDLEPLPTFGPLGRMRMGAF